MYVMVCAMPVLCNADVSVTDWSRMTASTWRWRCPLSAKWTSRLCGHHGVWHASRQETSKELKKSSAYASRYGVHVIQCVCVCVHMCTVHRVYIWCVHACMHACVCVPPSLPTYIYHCTVLSYRCPQQRPHPYKGLKLLTALSPSLSQTLSYQP